MAEILAMTLLVTALMGVLFVVFLVIADYFRQEECQVCHERVHSYDLAQYGHSPSYRVCLNCYYKLKD